MSTVAAISSSRSRKVLEMAQQSYKSASIKLRVNLVIILCVSQPNVDDKLLSNGIYKRLPSAKSKWKLLSNGI